MKTKIFGNPETIKKAENAKPGNKTIYINWDAINELPDEYEVIFTEINFDPRKLDIDFADVGNGNWMPTPKLMYRIADACGISGGEISITEPIIEEIDINPMLLKDIEDEPTIRRMTIGRRVRKYGTRIQEDGTELRSSVCTCEYNVWDRCCESWAKEELYTDGYKKAGKYSNKYETKFKRKLHFAGEMKFAHAKAETKAHEKTIRELAGLQTGYKAEDLSSGCLIFAKVRRSRKILQAETAARLAALSNGQAPPAEDTTKLLFGSEEPVKEEPVFETVEPVIDERMEMIDILEFYTKQDFIIEKHKVSISSLLTWLNGNEKAKDHEVFWPKAINALKEVESSIPEEGKINHKFY